MSGVDTQFHKTDILLFESRIFYFFFLTLTVREFCGSFEKKLKGSKCERVLKKSLCTVRDDTGGLPLRLLPDYHVVLNEWFYGMRIKILLWNSCHTYLSSWFSTVWLLSEPFLCQTSGYRKPLHPRGDLNQIRTRIVTRVWHYMFLSGSYERFFRLRVRCDNLSDSVVFTCT